MHPLYVIFGIFAGQQLAGITGIFSYFLFFKQTYVIKIQKKKGAFYALPALAT